MKKFLISTLFILLIVSCHKNQKQVTTIQENKKETNNNFSKTTIFEGTLPCADCSGIKTVLKIYNDYSVSQNNKFEVISTYEGKEPKNTFTEKGNFNTERGLENDPDGTIYVLNWDQPEAKQIYYGYFSKDPKKLFLLDHNRKIIKSDLNYSLVMKK